MSTCPSVVLTVNHAYHRKRVIHEANTLPHLRVTGLLDILFLLQMLPKLFSLFRCLLHFYQKLGQLRSSTWYACSVRNYKWCPPKDLATIVSREDPTPKRGKVWHHSSRSLVLLTQQLYVFGGYYAILATYACTLYMAVNMVMESVGFELALVKLGLVKTGIELLVWVPTLLVRPIVQKRIQDL